VCVCVCVCVCVFVGVYLCMCICVFVYVCEREERHLRETRLNKENEVSGSNANRVQKPNGPYLSVCHQLSTMSTPNAAWYASIVPGSARSPARKIPRKLRMSWLAGNSRSGSSFRMARKAVGAVYRFVTPCRSITRQNVATGSRAKSRDMSILDCVKYL